MEITLRNHVSKLRYMQQAVAECIADIQLRLQRSHVPKYNVDFGLICPVLFNRPAHGSKGFLYSMKATMHRVLEAGPQRDLFVLTISGPTLYEFFDQMNHLLEDLQKHLPSQIQQYRTDRELTEALVTSERIRTRLGLFTQQGYDRIIMQPVNELMAYMDSGALCGIGDVADVDILQDARGLRSRFEELMERQKLQRLPYDTGRGKQDSIFHYEMDAMNICLALASARHKGSELLFVTPTPFNLRACIFEEEQYSRRDRVPLFTQNAWELRDAGRIADAVEYLSDALRSADEIEKRLRQYEDIAHVPRYLELQLHAFYELYVGPLASPRRQAESFDADLQVDEIRETLSSRPRMKQVLDKAVDDLRTSAQLLEMHAGELDVSYVDELAMESHPILRSIRANLGLTEGSE